MSKAAKGYPERAYAKWLVLHFVWQRLSSVLGKKALKERFRAHSERGFFDKLDKAINTVFKGASTYYRANRGSGAKQIDPSVFFKRANHHTAFEGFWKSPTNKHRGTFDKAWTAFTQDLNNLEHE